MSSSGDPWSVAWGRLGAWILAPLIHTTLTERFVMSFHRFRLSSPTLKGVAFAAMACGSFAFWCCSDLSTRDSVANEAIRQAPQRVRPADIGVGTMVSDFSVTTIDGDTVRLSEYSSSPAVVIALTGTGCPLCLKYAPTIAEIQRDYANRGVEFILVNPNDSETVAAMREAISKHDFVGPYVNDTEMELCQQLDAKTTTEVFVLDRARTVVYRGAVDDQYGFGYALDAPRNNYLRNALDAVLADGRPDVSATTSPGCDLYYGTDRPAPKNNRITYHNRVSRILQANCVECHRDGGVGPMSLTTLDAVRDYAGMIKSVVQRGIMPPWFAAPHANHEQSSSLHWANDRSLSDADKKALFVWIEGGTPAGDPKDAPLPKQFPDGWLIGKPDKVYRFERPIAVKATGTMPYKNVTIETDLNEDKWVQAIEVRPGNPSVVHHVIVSIRTDGVREFSERDGYWGVYVPGNSKLVYPDGFAKKLPKGAKLRFQMHYTPNGTATEDLTQIGLIFAKEPPKHEIKVAGISKGGIRIPPHVDNHKETANLPVPYDVQVLSFLPHMHLRGKAAKYELLSSGKTETILDIPRYDFNWQLLYQLAEPMTIHKGDTIRFTAWYDNSDKNPANPDPTRTVRWGQQTEDEMHLGYVEYFVVGHTPGDPIPNVRAGRRNRGRPANNLFDRLDVNRDDVITKDEVRSELPDRVTSALRIFDRLDRNQDGKLSRDEGRSLLQRD